MSPGADADRPDGFGRDQLHYAALNDDVESAATLLARGANQDARDREGLTPLHFAAQQGSIRTARLLLDHGASVDPQDRDGNNAALSGSLQLRRR
jgi:ankyrin repeat protein